MGYVILILHYVLRDLVVLVGMKYVYVSRTITGFTGGLLSCVMFAAACWGIFARPNSKASRWYAVLYREDL